jgi:sulfite oxidase
MSDERTLLTATKPDLVALDTPELNAECPAHLLDDDITPTERLFVRNSGRMPDLTASDMAAWTLTIDGCVRNPQTWSVAQLQDEFETVTQIAVMECAGNGRAFFRDPTGTVPWTYGAVGCGAWTGVRLADLLRRCELLPNAVYTGHHSPDRDLDGVTPAISRGLPIAKALAPETLIVWAVNGTALPVLQGGPLRLIAPGFPGSASQKWLRRIEIRDCEHDGRRMKGQNYRMPRTPLRYGGPIDPAQLEVITDMPVKSLITSPCSDFVAQAGQPLTVRGHAWSGHTPVGSVDVSFDGGRSWQPAVLGPLPDRFAWRHFTATLDHPPAGPVEIVARATDAAGRTQPLDCVPWNPRGYCNNMVHRVAGRIA